MVSSNCRQRKLDATAEAAHGENGVDRRRRRDGRGQRPAGSRGLGTRSGAELHPVGTGGDPAQDYPGIAAGLSGSFRVARRRRVIDGGDGRDTRPERAGGEIPAVAGTFAAARAAHALLPQEEGWCQVTCTEFLAQLDDLIDDVVTERMRADLQGHLRGCEHCEVTLNTTRKTIEIYRSHEIYELPSGLRERLHSAIMARCKRGC